jgi:hypothetical protein
MPTPFNEYDLPSFPAEVLPAWIRSFVEQVTEALQTPVDLAAILSLTACATCVARNVEIEARPGWREPLNIYSLSVLDSANRKSKAMEEIIRPLAVFERDLLAEVKERIAEAVNEHRILESRLEKAQKDCAKLEGERLAKRKSEARELAIDLSNHEVPVEPRYFVDDTTSETLASRLSEQGGRMALFSPEGGIFETIAGKYSNGAPNIDVYLKGHSGDSLRVDRRQRSERIERPALTIGLAVQSDILHGLADKPGFRGRGLLGRFLYSLPESRLGGRKARPKPVSDEARRIYERHLIRLAAIKPIQTADGDEPHLLRLSREADDCLAAFQEEIEPKLAEGGEYAALRDWAGKLAGAVVRIAGLLHLADHAAIAPGFPVEVSAETVKRALMVGRYLIPHAQAAYSEMGADPEIEAARHVLRWIGKWVELGKDLFFRKQDVWQGTKGRFKKVSALEKTLALLCEHGYVRQAVKDASNRPGRKPGGIYEINPTITSYNSYNSYNSPEDGNSRDCRNCRTEGESQKFDLATVEDDPETEDCQPADVRSSDDLLPCSDCGASLEPNGQCPVCSDQMPF